MIDNTATVAETNFFSGFVSVLLFGFCVVLLINFTLVYHLYENLNQRSYVFNRLYLACIALPFFIISLINKQPLNLLGFNNIQWKKSILEGIGLSLVILVILVLIKAFIPFFNGHDLTNKSTPFFKLPGLYAYTYFISVIIQQSIRCNFQYYLHYILKTQNIFLPSVISALMFGVLHLHLGLSAVVLTALMGLLFSAVCHRHKNIYGTSIMHTTLGIAAFSLGLL